MSVDMIEKNLRILIIDDNRAIHEDFQKVLGASRQRDNDLVADANSLFDQPAPQDNCTRFKIDSAYQGEEGVEAVRQALQAGQPYAMAFVDIRMPPGIDGIETTAKLWKVYPDLQVVICSAHSDYSWEEMASRFGRSDRLVILKKPFENMEVQQLATALTEKWRLQQLVRREKEELEQLVLERTNSLKESEERYQLLFSKNPLPMWAFDHKTLRILAVNDTAIQNYGYSRNEFLAMSLKDLHPAEAVQALHENLSTPPDDLPNHFITRHRNKRGGLLDVETISRFVQFDGRPAMLTLANDITEKKRMEAHLLRSQRMDGLGTLAVGLAHDLNNVLTPIMISASSLRLDLPPKEREKTLDCLEISTQRGADLIKQVLAFGRGVAGERLPIAPETLLVELSKIISQTFSKEIKLEFRAETDLWQIVGDRTQLSQVLLNLCLNARDAMPKGGELSLHFRNLEVDRFHAMPHSLPVAPGRYVLMEVADTGCGISPTQIEKIFDPFFTTKEFGSGTGLGLSTAVGILKSHKGSIWVDSELNHGTVFKILLPAVLPTDAGVIAEQPAGCPNGRDETILVVDDEEPILAIVRVTLESQGYKVLTANRGAEAVELFRRHQQEIQLVLVDIVMPEMNGAELARKLRQIDPEIKLVASSGLRQDLGDKPSAGLGASKFDHFLAKPFTTDGLLHALRLVLAAPVAA